MPTAAAYCEIASGSTPAYDRLVAELPAGTVTFAFTDVEDSPELLKRLGDECRDVPTAEGVSSDRT